MKSCLAVTDVSCLGNCFWVQNDRSLLAVKVDVEDKSLIWKQLAWISYLKFQYCIYLSWWITSNFRGELFDDKECKPCIDQSCWGNSMLFCQSLAFSLKGSLFVFGWRAVLLCVEPTWPWVSSGCLQSRRWMGKIFFFFAVDAGTALLLLVSGVCLWDNYLPDRLPD